MGFYTYDRRSFLKSLGAGLGLTAFAGVSMAMEASKCHNKKLPNIILILADDLGYNELGCYGQKKIKTPNIDRLATEGLSFKQFYASSAVCAPSRCGLMTGKHCGHADIRDNFKQEDPDAETFGGQLPLSGSETTIAEVLKGCGYTTGCFGKWGLGITGNSGDPMKQGFDRFYGYECQTHAHNLYPRYLMSDGRKEMLSGNSRGLKGEKYAPQLIADEMLKFVRQNKNRPFFAYYPTIIPHVSLQVPEEDLNKYKGKWPETPYDTGEGYLPHPTPKACYAAMVSFLDKQVGRLLSTLKELDLSNDTIVIFTSDNGTTYLKKQVDYEFFESVGKLRGLKGSLYEGGIRVPLIARWPGKIKQNSVTNHIAANYDFFATFCEIADIDMNQGTDSISFLPELLDRKDQQKKHEYLFWDFRSYGGQLAVRIGKWKGVKQDMISNHEASVELYDLEKDISEKNNLAEQYPAITAKIENIMVQARTSPKCEKFLFGSYADSKNLKIISRGICNE
jgi:arylsulfatase